MQIKSSEIKTKFMQKSLQNKSLNGKLCLTGSQNQTEQIFAGKEGIYQVMKYNAETVLANIRAERARKNVKVSEIAEKLAISESTYYQKEKGKSYFTIPEFVSLCNILEVPASALLEKPA